MNHIEDEINELDSFKDAIVILKRYLNTRNQLRVKMSRQVDQYNSYLLSRNIEGVRMIDVHIAIENKVTRLWSHQRRR